ncbi:MAG: PEP-CTERM sorting domain-containing protein [Chthoniobacterales bacterium]
MKKKLSALLSLLSLALSATTSHLQAQATPPILHTINGQEYEAVEWPTTGGIQTISGTTTASGSWTLNGGGTVTISGNTQIDFLSENDFVFTNAPYSTTSPGYAISDVDRFRVNGGQAAGGTALTQTYTLTSPNNPTQMLFYIGVNGAGTVNNGLKFASWNFSTTDTSTTFNVLGNTASFTGNILNNGTSNLSWKTFTDNNAAAILVSVSNLDGINHFSIQTNRLSGTGNPQTYGNTTQRADFNPIAFLIPVPEPSAALLLSLSGSALLLLRKRRV